MITKSPFLNRTLGWLRLDLAPSGPQPSAVRVLIASVVSIVGSLAADAALVAIGTAVAPSTKGYVHFRFSDYSKLTIIGVVVACIGWPVVTRISSGPKWLYGLLAIGTTLVLLLPDVWLVSQGQPTKAVIILMFMHLAIAIVTYLSMVLIASPGTEDLARE